MSVGTGGLAAEFDRVLVDAPCTGLGTVLRRPELLLRLRPEDPKRMAQLQLKILRSAAQLVKPGGLLGLRRLLPDPRRGTRRGQRVQCGARKLRLRHGTAQPAPARS